MTTDLRATPRQSHVAELAVQSILVLGVLTLVTGVAYPLAVTGIAKAVFAERANGSLVSRDGRLVGSAWVGQGFEDPKHFWGRLSATTPATYNAAASTGSNLGPTNDVVAKNARARIDALRAADPENADPIPVDLVTSSASGLDPHISPAAAAFQVRRVARARSISEERVRALVARFTEERDLGVLGEPRVNVLLLNLELDRQ